jgi:hypothetical protein
MTAFDTSAFDDSIRQLNNVLATSFPTHAAPMAKAEPAGISETQRQRLGRDLLAKGMESVRKGHITSAQLSEAEALINNGKAPSAPLIKAIVDDEPYWPFV